MASSPFQDFNVSSSTVSILFDSSWPKEHVIPDDQFVYIISLLVTASQCADFVISEGTGHSDPPLRLHITHGPTNTTPDCKQHEEWYKEMSNIFENCVEGRYNGGQPGKENWKCILRWWYESSTDNTVIQISLGSYQTKENTNTKIFKMRYEHRRQNRVLTCTDCREIFIYEPEIR